MVCKVLLPEARREFCDARCGMLIDPLQHVDGISEGIDLMQPASDHQTLHDAHRSAPNSVQVNSQLRRLIGIAGSFCPYRARS
jgi:hypothetical protein